MSSFSLPRDPRCPVSLAELGWLPLSVALNLVLIGLVVAWELNLPPPPRQPLVTWQRELIPSLSPADAAIVTEAAGQVADAQAAGDRGCPQLSTTTIRARSWWPIRWTRRR